jgi:hypothetical protein
MIFRGWVRFLVGNRKTSLRDMTNAKSSAAALLLAGQGIAISLSA